MRKLGVVGVGLITYFASGCAAPGGSHNYYMTKFSDGSSETKLDSRGLNEISILDRHGGELRMEIRMEDGKPYVTIISRNNPGERPSFYVNGAHPLGIGFPIEQILDGVVADSKK